jgi:hypothetical protein
MSECMNRLDFFLSWNVKRGYTLLQLRKHNFRMLHYDTLTFLVLHMPHWCAEVIIG